MKSSKVARVHICDEKRFFGSPVIETFLYGKGVYKDVINRLSYEEYDIITIPEYDGKIVKYANKKGLIVEEEAEYIPSYIESKLRERFYGLGPLDLGIVFSQKDARLAEKIVMPVAKYCRFLSLPAYPRCKRLAQNVLKNNGLQINLENTLEKINKKCDIILNVENLEITSGRSV